MTIVSVYWLRQRFFTLCLNVFKLFVFELFHEGSPYHIKTNPLIYQWNGFYMIETSIKKELMSSGRLFHKKGPMYDNVLYSVLVLGKGCLILSKLFLVYILQCGTNSMISFKLQRRVAIDKLKSYCIYALVNSSLVGNQFIDLNP